MLSLSVNTYVHLYVLPSLLWFSLNNLYELLLIFSGNLVIFKEVSAICLASEVIYNQTYGKVTAVALMSFRYSSSSVYIHSYYLVGFERKILLL